MVKCPDPDCTGELLLFLERERRRAYERETTGDYILVYVCTKCGKEVRLGDLPFRQQPT